MDKYTKERNQLVVKSNKLIQKTRYNLTAQEQKIILYVISKITPNDTDLQEYHIKLTDLCGICGIEAKGNNYDRFRKSIQSLANKSFWLSNQEQDILCRWIEKVRINKKDGDIAIRLDDDLMPYLIELKSNFTSFDLDNILIMDSKYSIRLFELLKSYLYIGKLTITVDELRKYFCLENKYERFNNLRQKVLEPAIEEINKYSDIEIELNTEKYGNKVLNLIFNIRQKDNGDLADSMFLRMRELENRENR